MDMLPYRPVGAQMQAAVRAGLFRDGVDFVVMQELFRSPWWVCGDTCVGLLRAVHKDAAGGVPAVGCVAVVPLATTSVAKFTDSGLAVASVGPGTDASSAACVAFMPLCGLRSFDRFADKGVAVFELRGGLLRIAVTHMQASYAPNELAADNEVRIREFERGVAFAVQYGAALFAGDINIAASETEAMARLDDIVTKATRGKGGRFPDDGRATSHRFGIGSLDWRDNPAHATKIDHCWILNHEVVAVVQPGVTRAELTRGWSDHAAVDFTVMVTPPAA